MPYQELDTTTVEVKETFFDWLADLYSQSIWWQIVWWWIALYGSIKVLSVVWRYMKFQCKHRCRKEKIDLYAKYGDKVGGQTYGVVTGGSDGIGFAYCKHLAQEGFNVCIMGRNQKKMDEKIEEIKKLDGVSDKIQFKTIVCDFTKMAKISDYDDAVKELAKIDIGIFILNAGWGDAFPAHVMPEDWVHRQTIMNVAQIPYLTTKVLPLIKARHHQKSAIVMVSSIAALMEGPCGQLYNGSKKYVLKFAQCLHEEYKNDGIDILSYNPGFVDTPLIKAVPDNFRVGCISPERAAVVTFRDLGIDSWTTGDIAHDRFVWFASLIPISLVADGNLKLQEKMFKEDKKYQWIWDELEQKKTLIQ